MISFEEAGTVLDEAADALPSELYDRLNGGVNLLPATRTDSNGLMIMGMYIVDQMGRRVELYYGSFSQTYRHATPEKCRRELVKVLKHELTHHLENMALDRSLEKWDEQHVASLLSGLADEPLDAESILFVDDDAAGLAPMADGLFRVGASQSCPEIRSSYAGLAETVPETVNPKAAKAALLYGVDISNARPQRAYLGTLDAYDVILCMSERQCNILTEQFPSFDAKVMCLGQEDINPPVLDMQGGWNRAADKLVSEIGKIIEELCMEDEDADP